MMYDVFFVVLYADVTCVGHFLIYGVTKQRMKSRIRFWITSNIELVNFVVLH